MSSSDDEFDFVVSPSHQELPMENTVFQANLRKKAWLGDRPAWFIMVKIDGHGENLSYYTILRSFFDKAWISLSQKAVSNSNPNQFNKIKSLEQRTTSTGVEIQALLRDAISHPRYFSSVTGWWLLEKFTVFLQFIQLSLLIVNLMLSSSYVREFMKDNDFCYFETATGDILTTRVNSTCRKPGEEFFKHAKRLVEFFVVRRNASCNEIVSLTGSRLGYPPNYENGVFIDNVSSSFAALNYVQDLQRICPNFSVCQRYLLLTMTTFDTEWWFSTVVSSDLFVETEWGASDGNCRKNLRAVAVARKEISGVEFANWGHYVLLSLFVVCFAVACYSLLCYKNYTLVETYASTRLRNERFETRKSYFKHWFLVAATLIFAAITFILFAASVSFQIVGLWFACAFSTIRFIFPVFFPHCFRLVALFRHSFVAKRDEKTASLDKKTASRSNFVERARLGELSSVVSFIFTPDEFTINDWSVARTGLNLICNGFFAFSSAWLALHLPSESTQEKIESFKIWAALCPLFVVFQIVYAPIGLEFVSYLPQLVGSTTKFQLGYFEPLFYVALPLALSPPGFMALPSSVNDIGAYVSEVLNGISIYFGALEFWFRLLAVFGLFLLILLFVIVVVEIQSERDGKPFKIIVCSTMVKDVKIAAEQYLSDFDRMRHYYQAEARIDPSSTTFEGDNEVQFLLSPAVQCPNDELGDLDDLDDKLLVEVALDKHESRRHLERKRKYFDPFSVGFPSNEAALIQKYNNLKVAPPVGRDGTYLLEDSSSSKSSVALLLDSLFKLALSSVFVEFVNKSMIIASRSPEFRRGLLRRSDLKKSISCLEFLSIICDEMTKRNTTSSFFPAQLISIHGILMQGRKLQQSENFIFKMNCVFDFFFRFFYPSLVEFGISPMSLRLMFCRVLGGESPVSLVSVARFQQQVANVEPDLILLLIDSVEGHKVSLCQKFELANRVFRLCSAKLSSPNVAPQSAVPGGSSTQSVALYQASSRSSTTAWTSSTPFFVHNFALQANLSGRPELRRGFSPQCPPHDLHKTASELHLLLCSSAFCARLLAALESTIASDALICEIQDARRVLYSEGGSESVPCPDMPPGWFKQLVNSTAAQSVIGELDHSAHDDGAIQRSLVRRGRFLVIVQPSDSLGLDFAVDHTGETYSLVGFSTKKDGFVFRKVGSSRWLVIERDGRLVSKNPEFEPPHSSGELFLYEKQPPDEEEDDREKDEQENVSEKEDQEPLECEEVEEASERGE